MKYPQFYEQVFGEKYVKEKYTFDPHAFTKIIVGKKCCRKCGLLALNNEFSQWAVEKGCNSSYHPSYNKVRKKYTKLHGVK